MKANADPYLMLGVRPFINCCSVRTMHGGSLMLPQVRDAMAEASRHFACRRVDGGGGATACRYDRRRMGHRHLRQRRGRGARNSGMRGRRRPGQDAAPALYRRDGKPGPHSADPAFCLCQGGAA